MLHIGFLIEIGTMSSLSYTMFSSLLVKLMLTSDLSICVGYSDLVLGHHLISCAFWFVLVLNIGSADGVNFVFFF